MLLTIETKEDGTMKKSTDMIELAETHNLYLSLKRLIDTPPYDCRRWKRALYHALAMSLDHESTVLKQIREAMQLP